jgi:hypothetical protein
LLTPDTEIYFAAVNCMNDRLNVYWDNLYPRLGPNAKFWIDIGRYLGKNRIINRHGEWNSPWKTKIVPGFEMPNFDPHFKMTFEEVTYQRTLDIKKIIHSSDSRIGVFYSGGIDSTVCLAALIKFLNPEELKKIDICLSAESIVENPTFYEKFILNKFNIFDSAKTRYDYFQQNGHYAITSDQGDSIFGTELGTKLYFSYFSRVKSLSSASRSHLVSISEKISDPDTSYENYKDLLMSYFQLPNSPEFGEKFYIALDENIKSSAVPVLSLHDFFWWYIFNIKYMECALRSTVYYTTAPDIEKSIQSTVINWFNHPNYQLWSMANNNNGTKIKGLSPASYKMAARQFIYELDQNEWYFRYKSKLSSLINITQRNKDVFGQRSIFALDSNYNTYYQKDPDTTKFIEDQLEAYG